MQKNNFLEYTEHQFFLFCGTFNGNLLSKIDYNLYIHEMKMFSKYADK